MVYAHAGVCLKMFTKQHYIKIAELLATCDTTSEFLIKIADEFESDSKKFDRAKFMAFYSKKRVNHLRMMS